MSIVLRTKNRVVVIPTPSLGRKAALIAAGLVVGIFSALVWSYFIGFDLDGSSPGSNRRSNPVSFKGCEAIDEQRQSENWQDIQAVMFSDEPGDDDVIAIVGGIDGPVVERRDLRVKAEVYAVNCPGLSFSHALDEVIVPRMGTAILHAEAIRLGHKPTYEEVQEYIQPFKEACDGPQGGDCRELIKSQGYTDEEKYWKDTVQGYTRDLAIINLRSAYTETMLSDRTEEWGTLEEYELSLHDSVDIEWKDDELKARYELALKEVSE